MTSIGALAEELGVSPGDIREVAPATARVSGLLTDAQADEVRAVLDPDGDRAGGG